MKDISRCALPIVLALVAGPNLVAQRLACYTIQRGDTAARVALRVSGDARNRHEPWFQIVDPATSRFVSKAEYDRVHPGWRACIVNDAVKIGPGGRQSASVTGAGLSVPSGLSRKLRVASSLSRKLPITLIWVGAVGVVIWLAWCVGEEYVSRREAVLSVMTRFGERFIREFERPLIQPHVADRPVRSQLRFSPHRARLDILLAPGTGRRYPNLCDHRRNVEYDVARVLRLLADQPFVSGPLHAQEEWVVVPFQLNIGSKQVGVN